MQTTEVNSSNEFSATIALESGNYLIKVADYEGGTFAEKSIKETTNNTNTEAEGKSDVEKELTNTEETTNTTNTADVVNKADTTEKDTKTTVKSSNPTTGDNIIMIISVFAVAALGAFITLKLYKNNKTRKH